MRKFLYISLLLLFLLPEVQGQKKYIYQDSSLLKRDDEPVKNIDAPIDDTAPEEDVVAIDEVVVKPDTSLYANQLSISADSLYKWRKEKDFAYLKYMDSLLKAKEKKDKPQTRRSTRGGGLFSWLLSTSFIQIILWMLAIGFVLFIIYRLFLADSVFMRRRKKINAAEAEVEEEEINHETDFERLIRQSLQSNNYRQAVRYQYLRTLHTLAEKGFFELQPDKTNYQYVYEMGNKQHQNDFAAITLNYEYVWYGEFAIDEELYRKIETGFIALNKKL